MRLRWPSRTKKPKNTILSKKAELLRDQGKMAHRQMHQVQALEGTRLKSFKSTAELFAGREVLRAGSTSLRASFTVSPQGDYQCCVLCLFVCWLLGRFLLLCFFTGISPFFLSIAFDAQGRHSSKTVTIVMMSAAQEQKKNLHRALSNSRSHFKYCEIACCTALPS